ncbi:MAG: DUF721 domain-containing protein [Nitrospinae bacterium]|nr:DUF721 domain-containing protein [Nitrospinota bacterium]
MPKSAAGSPFWTDMRTVLSMSFKSAEAFRHNRLDWLQLQWDLSVGEEIAAISRVERESGKTLHVTVAGAEWAPPLKSLEKKILRDITEGLGEQKFARIVFKEGRVAGQAPGGDAAMTLRDRRNPVPPPGKREAALPPEAPEINEGNMTMIKDDSLRKTLISLGSRLRWLPALIAGFVFLPNCAAGPAYGTSGAAVLDDSFTVREVQKRNEKEGADFKDPRAYYRYLMGVQAEARNDFDAAAREYALLIKYDPKTSRFYGTLAGLYLRTGQFQEGVKFCKAALDRFPDDVDIRMALADMLSSLDQNAAAVEQYLKIVGQEPANTRAILLSGTLYDRLGQYDRSLEMYKKAAMAENNPIAFHYLGKAQVRDNDLKEALENFKKAVSLRPNFLDSREYLAWVLEKLGSYNEAIQEYQIILKLNPEHREVREYLARAYPQGIPASGMKPLVPADREIKDSSVHMKIGIIYYEQAMYLKALDEFRLIVAREDTRNLRLVIARIYELMGRLDKAIAELEVLHEEDPKAVDILLQMALLSSMNNQTDKAVEKIREAIQLEPQNDQLYHSLALAYIALKDNEKAAESLRRAIAINDKRDSYYFELGSLQEKMGQVEDAIRSMKKTLELNPMHSNAHNFLGYIYSLRGIKLNEALEHLQKALEAQPRNGYFLDSLGWIYFKKGDPEKALVELKKAVIYTAPDPILYDHLGEIYFELKNYEEAGKAWQTSLSLTRKKKFEPGAELPETGDLEEKIRKVKYHLDKSL